MVMVSALCSLQCSDTDGWVTCKNFIPLVSKGTGGEGGPKGKPADPGSSGKMPKNRCSSSHSSSSSSSTSSSSSSNSSMSGSSMSSSSMSSSSSSYCHSWMLVDEVGWQCSQGYNRNTSFYSSTSTSTTTVLRPIFRDHPGEPVPEENFWTLWCKGRLTEADTPTIWLGATPSGLTRANLHHPHFFTVLQVGYPSCRPTNSVKALMAGFHIYSLTSGLRQLPLWP